MVTFLALSYQRLNRFNSMVRITLTISIEVNGMKTLPCCVSTRISPGNRPNQFSDHGAKCNSMPTIRNSTPVIINHLAM